jgi:hypothetical protein
MNIKHYQSYFEKTKTYKSIFKLKEDINGDGVPEANFQVMLNNKLKDAKKELLDANRQSDPEMIDYWNDYINYLYGYSKDPNFGNAKKIANQEETIDTTEGAIDAAKFVIKLYGT